MLLVRGATALAVPLRSSEASSLARFATARTAPTAVGQRAQRVRDARPERDHVPQDPDGRSHLGVPPGRDPEHHERRGDRGRRGDTDRSESVERPVPGARERVGVGEEQLPQAEDGPEDRGESAEPGDQADGVVVAVAGHRDPPLAQHPGLGSHLRPLWFVVAAYQAEQAAALVGHDDEQDGYGQEQPPDNEPLGTRADQVLAVVRARHREDDEAAGSRDQRGHQQWPAAQQPRGRGQCRCSGDDDQAAPHGGSSPVAGGDLDRCTGAATPGGLQDGGRRDRVAQQTGGPEDGCRAEAEAEGDGEGCEHPTPHSAPVRPEGRWDGGVVVGPAAAAEPARVLHPEGHVECQHEQDDEQAPGRGPNEPGSAGEELVAPGLAGHGGVDGTPGEEHAAGRQDGHRPSADGVQRVQPHGVLAVRIRFDGGGLAVLDDEVQGDAKSHAAERGQQQVEAVGPDRCLREDIVRVAHGRQGEHPDDGTACPHVRCSLRRCARSAVPEGGIADPAVARPHVGPRSRRLHQRRAATEGPDECEHRGREHRCDQDPGRRPTGHRTRPSRWVGRRTGRRSTAARGPPTRRSRP